MTDILALLALGLFAFWTQKHVGESYFLADQVDQLQKYEAFLRLEPEGLWGPVMSGTQARALGPFGAIVFGLPVSLGFGINSTHATTSLLLVVATALAFFQLRRVSEVLAWSWLIVFTAMQTVWWAAAMFWVNTLLLPVGLVLLALCVSCLRYPTQAKLAAAVLIVALALQQHLIALVAAPIVMWLIASTWYEAVRRPPSRVALMALVALALAVVAPYLLAESETGFRNTRAIVSHLASTSPGNTDGRKAATEALTHATDPMALFSADSTKGALLTGSAIAFAGLGLVLFHRRQKLPGGFEHEDLEQMLWLVTAAMIGVATQALFFFMMARPLNGLHYVLLLAPWYAIPLAVLISGLLRPAPAAVTRVAPAVLGTLAVVLLIVRAPVLADRFAEVTPWNYRAINTALDTLCAGQAVATVEGPGLINELTPSYDSVLQYLMKRGYSSCRYDPASEVVILANRTNDFGDVLVTGGIRFKRELVLAPGLARYRRLPEGRRR